MKNDKLLLNQLKALLTLNTLAEIEASGEGIDIIYDIAYSLKYIPSDDIELLEKELAFNKQRAVDVELNI